MSIHLIHAETLVHATAMETKSESSFASPRAFPEVAALATKLQHLHRFGNWGLSDHIAYCRSRLRMSLTRACLLLANQTNFKRTLFVCVFVCVFPSEVITPLFGVTSSNVELRNYVISCQNIIKSSYAIRSYHVRIFSNNK